MRRTAPALILALILGCAPRQPADLEPVAVTRDMRQLVRERYQTVIKGEIAMPTSAVFTEDPLIQAHRNKANGRNEVWAQGEFHAQNEEGLMARHVYHLVWEEGFGGWKLRDKSVAPAEE